MSRGRSMQAQDDPTAQTQAASRSDRASKWLRVPLIVAALLAIMLSIVPNRRRWLMDNPIDVLIVVLTPPFLPATMKLARVLPVVRLLWLMAIAHRLRDIFSLQGLRYAALIVFTVVVGGGVVFVAVEPAQDLSTWD